jgi:hypothetical protein
MRIKITRNLSSHHGRLLFRAPCGNYLKARALLFCAAKFNHTDLKFPIVDSLRHLRPDNPFAFVLLYGVSTHMAIVKQTT